MAKKDKTYSPVTLFVLVLVILVYMFTLIYVRMGKDRKGIGKDQTLCYIYLIFYIKWDIRKGKWLYIFFAVFINICPPHSFPFIKFIYNSHCLLVPVVFIEQFLFVLAVNVLPLFHYAVTQVTSFLLSIRLYWHHTAIILFYYQLWSSSCGNSISWLWHQICDNSFFYFTLIVLRMVKFYVFRLFVVVSTTSVVWSQVRWFFLLRNVFCAINHDE